MPSPSTALDIIKAAMRHIGAIATGETPSAAEATDGLASLNDVIETWNTDGLLVYESAVQSFTTTPAQAAYTIGPSGQFVTARPVEIEGVYASYLGVDYRVAEWTYDQYQSATIKATGALYPTRYAYINDFPNGRLFLWPVPSVAITLNISVQTQLAYPANLATVLSLPPAYARALQWELAAEMAPSYGYQFSQDQKDLLRSSKAAVKKSNHSGTVSRLDQALLRRHAATWQAGW